MRKDTKKYLLGIFSITAFLLRLLPWKNTIVEGGKWVIFVQPDAYYHLRRATIWAKNFPKIITIDNYMSYPFGAECPWPPLYDWLIAVTSLIAGGGKYHREVLHIVTALFPPIIAGLCILPLYLVVKLLWKNERIALISAFFAIIMPGMLGYSTVASGDHHIAETLIGLWFYYFALNIVIDCESQKVRPKNIILAGLFIAIGLLVWQGEVVFYSVFAVYLAVVIMYRKKEIDYIDRLTSSFLITAIIGALVTAFVRFIIPHGTNLSYFDFGYFSYFQPIYVFTIFLVTYILGKLVIYYQKDRKKFIIWGGILVVAILLMILLVKPLRVGIWQGVNFLFKTDPWHSSINEFQSTFSIKLLKASFENIDGLTNLMYFVSFLFPFIYSLYFIVKIVRNKDISFSINQYELKINKVNKTRFITSNQIFCSSNSKYVKDKNLSLITMTMFFIIVGTAFFLLALYQKRWTNSYSPILSVGIALFSNTIYLKAKRGYSFFRDFLHWRKNIRRHKMGIFSKVIFYWEKFPVALSVFVILVVLLPYYIIASDMLMRKGYPIESDIYNTLQWMRIYTPPTNYLYEPDKKPEYGVISHWDMGHFIQYIAERPTIVNNFGHQLPGDGFKTSLYIWSAESDEELENILDKYKIRYLILMDPVFFMNENSKAYLKKGFIENSIEYIPAHFDMIIPSPKDNFFRYPLPNAWIFDGSSNGFRTASKYLRLVFESQNPLPIQYFEGLETKKLKIFEKVKGVRIKGLAKPRDLIYIKAEFVTNFDRNFLWEAASIANDKGEFTAYLPYATAEDNLFVKPLSPFYFYSNDKVVKVFTTNDEVIKGSEKEINMIRGENIPDFLKNEIKNKLATLAGNLKSKSYIKFHRKLNE